MKIQHTLRTLFFLFFATLIPLVAHAHEPNHTYLYMRIYGEAIGGHIEVNGADINRVFGLNISEELKADELQQYLPSLQSYIKSKLKFSAGNTSYPIKFSEVDILDLDEEIDFLNIPFDLEGVTELPEKLQVDYNIFLDEIDTQRGILIIEYNWKAGVINNHTLINTVFGDDDRKEELVLAEKGILKGFWALVKLGVWHIWIGLDHILFIVALILPSVVRRREGEVMAAIWDDSYSTRWMPVSKFKPAFLYIIKIITFFTVAHSITLALAALEIVNLSSRIVETIIAFSIALAAFHNIRPIFKTQEWIIAFVFGLFHGFGFASVLGEKGLSGDFMVLSLLGFNLGVELGQVLIICMIFPILYLIRSYKIYPRIIIWGSVLLIFIALYWSIERGFEVDLTLGTYFWKFYNSVLG